MFDVGKEIGKHQEVKEIQTPEAENFRTIKPEAITPAEARKFWDEVFGNERQSHESKDAFGKEDLRTENHPERTLKEQTIESTGKEIPSVESMEGLIKNKRDGLEREKQVEGDLFEKYPANQGYKIESEVYLRDKNDNIVKDPVTGEKRRIDFVVIKGGNVVDSIEVTSMTADKTMQLAKEDRIRDNGGNYIKDSNGNLVQLSNNVKTRIERRE